MTRTGSSRQVGPDYAPGRLKKAIAFHEAARIILEKSGQLLDPDTVSSNATLAIIAYADALTAAYAGRVNQKDHSAVAKLLRDALGKALPDAQERRLIKLIGRKDEFQYGAFMGKSDDARQILQSLDEFAAWAVDMLKAKSISV